MTSTTDAIDLPFDEAIRFFRDKASVTTKQWTDVYAAAHSRAFMVAGAATSALVADFRREIEKALEQGTTLADFRSAFDDIVKRHGWEHTGSRNWRSGIIFDTNLRAAYSAGRYAKLTETDTLEAFPYWQYNHSGSLHPRKEHLAWDGLTLPASDAFWRTNYPPNGWRCGCFVIPLGDRDLKRQGKKGPDEAPDLLFRAEEVGGRRVMVPFGVDPGFEYNPGQAWLSRSLPGSQTVAAAPGLIARFVGSSIKGTLPGNTFVPVAIAPAELAEALRVPAATEIRLSADTIRSHLRHREATAEAYGTLPEFAIGDGLVVSLKDRVTVFLETEGAIWRMGVKRTEVDELYVTTLHRSNPDQVNRFRATGKVILEGKNAPGGSAVPR